MRNLKSSQFCSTLHSTMGSLLLWASGLKFSKKIFVQKWQSWPTHVFQNDPENFPEFKVRGKNPEFFFQDRALKIVFLDFSLNFEAISYKTLFCCTNIKKKCQLISAVCLLFFKPVIISEINQLFLEYSKLISWLYL